MTTGELAQPKTVGKMLIVSPEHLRAFIHEETESLRLMMAKGFAEQDQKLKNLEDSMETQEVQTTEKTTKTTKAKKPQPPRVDGFEGMAYAFHKEQLDITTETVKGRALSEAELMMNDVTAKLSARKLANEARNAQLIAAEPMPTWKKITLATVGAVAVGGAVYGTAKYIKARRAAGAVVAPQL